MSRKVDVTRRTRLAAGLLRETCLSTSGPRLVMVALLAVGTLSTALPATAANFNVGNEAQLRGALNDAQNGDTITFTANITLSADLPHVRRDVTVNGGNHVLSGNNQYRGLFVQSGTVAINDLTIANAKAQGGNGGSGAGTDGDGGGGGGVGGALFVANGANVTVSNVNLQDNVARGGNGAAASGGDSGGGGGGGMFGNGTVANGGKPGQGGFGGGGNGGAPVNNPGAPGGFGGGGGGGAGRGPGGTGGFGGGGGGSFTNGRPGSGGFGGGSGNAYDHGGGGGAGLGGAIFAQQGGTLTLAGSLAISGNTVAGGSAGTSRATAGQGFGSGIFLQGNGSFTLAPGAGQTQTISDAIADQTGVAGSGGSWSLVKNGVGTTILTGENAYSGGATVNAGVLQGNTSSLKGNITITTDNASVVFSQTDDGTYAGSITGSGGLTKSGKGNVTLRGTNTYTGTTTINGGALLLSSAASLSGTGGSISLNNGTIGSVVTPQDGDAAVIDRAVTIANEGGFFVASQFRGLSVNSVIGGSGRLVKSGVGELVLNNNNTYSGGTEVREGILRFTNNSNLGEVHTRIELDGGSIGTNFNTPAATSFDRGITLAGDGGIDVTLHPVTWSGNIDGTGQFIKSGNGELELSGNNTYTGGTLVQRGNLRIASDDKLGAAGTGITLNDNGTLRTAASFTSARPISMTGAGGAFQVDVDMTMTLSGVVSGTNLTKIDRGTLVLTGANTYTGNTNVFGGTVQGSTASIRGNIVFDPNKDNLFARSVTFDQLTDGTFAGNITNKGSIAKTGAGTLILSGNNSYTDGTTVSAGTLQGTTRSLQGNILNNAAVIFDQSFEGSYAGAMTGAGTLTKNGTGKLALTANNTVGGGTTLNAGGLALNGILHSNVTMNGGILSGAGNIVGNITQNGGEIAPGNSIGHFTIDGNVTVNRGILEFEINPNGTSDRITVTGAGRKATLNGGTVEVLALPGAYTPNTVYTIVATSGGVVGTFTSVSEDFAFLTPTLSYDPNNVYLSLLLGPNAFHSAGQTPNQRSVGGALDATAASGNVGGIVTVMANLSSDQGASALQALSGEVHASLKGALLEDSRFVREAALERTRAAFAGVATPSLPVMGYGPDGAAPVRADTDRFAAWARGFGSWGEWESDGNTAGFERSIGGLLIGADALVTETWRVGLLTGYSRSSFQVDDPASSGESDNYHLGLFGGTQWGNLGLRLGAAHTWHDIETDRAIAFGESAQASYDARTAQVFGELGYRIERGGFAFEPFANLAYVNVHTDGFPENCGAAALTSASANLDATFTTLGLRAATDFRLGGVKATSRGMVGWRHAFGDVTPLSSFALAGSDAFTIAGTPIAEDALVLEAGFDVGLSEKASLGLSYSGQIASEASDHGFRADLTVKF